MAHKTRINGTNYGIKGGKCRVNGTNYSIKKGRTLIGGTGYNITFGTPLSALAVGTIVYIKEGTSNVPFYVAKHNYESGLNGNGRTLLVRKDAYDKRKWHTSNVNAYATSNIDTWLNGTYKNLFSSTIRSAMGSTKFYYTIGSTNGTTVDKTVTALSRSVFLLSLTELGVSSLYSPNTEGSALPIASSLKVAYYNGTAVNQWTRTPSTSAVNYVHAVLSGGGDYRGTPVTNYYSRPAFTLPSATIVDDNYLVTI